MPPCLSGRVNTVFATYFARTARPTQTRPGTSLKPAVDNHRQRLEATEL